MGWVDPVIDWEAGDVPVASDFNRIEANTAHLNKGGGGTVENTSVVNPTYSDPNYLLDINSDSDVFIVNGEVTIISHINVVDRPANNKIIIINDTGDDLAFDVDNGSKPAVSNYKTIKWSTNTDDFVLSAGCTVSLVFTGSYWYIGSNL